MKNANDANLAHPESATFEQTVRDAIERHYGESVGESDKANDQAVAAITKAATQALINEGQRFAALISAHHALVDDMDRTIAALKQTQLTKDGGGE